MSSRYFPTNRIPSGVIFSAPGNLLKMPEGGWGDDPPIYRSKRPSKNHTKRGIDSFPVFSLSTAMPIHEPYDNHALFAQDKGYKGYKIASSPPPALPEVPQDQHIAGTTLCLPVLNVSLTATVDGTIAHVELVQSFDNPSDLIIDTAKHIFPLYDRAVITSFECTIGDERRVIGVVKPKAQARQDFEDAVRDRIKAPAILEEHTPEIFETSLGNIPAGTTVEIKITYVQELKVVMMETEATEGITLTIPLSIAPRYSKSPVPWDTESKLRDEKLDIWVRLVDDGRVNHEGCKAESDHGIEFEGTKTAVYSHESAMGPTEVPGRYSIWHHQSHLPVLREDFVFVIQMQEGYYIQSRAVACPADSNGLGAMVLSIRPNDLFRNAIIPKSFTGEILFLLDGSGSMALGYGNKVPKIIVMREAMLLALAGIPTTCIFNIVSWGSATVGLWGSSKPASEENIKEAKDYVSHIKADMGGTDLLRALEAVVRRRDQQRGPTQIIVLTDGELEPEESIQFIWKKRQLLGDSIRFFALGIGDEVSHRLVESIAECGGGYSDVVHTTKTPRWHDRLNRLVKSALQPNSWSYDISLGSGFERQSLVVDELGDEKALASGKVPYFLAPFPNLPLHPFSFNSISFLFNLRHGGALPKTVTITTTTPEARKKSYELPVQLATGGDVAIRSLVAKSVLLNLDVGEKRGETMTQVAKANAEEIGIVYSITSKWTSFVAVSENEPTQAEEEQKMNHYKALFDEINIDQLLLHAGTNHSPLPRSLGTQFPDPDKDLQVGINQPFSPFASSISSSPKFENECSTRPAVNHEESDRSGDGDDTFQKAHVHNTAYIIPLPPVSSVDDGDETLAPGGKFRSGLVSRIRRFLKSHPRPKLVHRKAMAEGIAPTPRISISAPIPEASLPVDQEQSSAGVSLPPAKSSFDTSSGLSSNFVFDRSLPQGGGSMTRDIECFAPSTKNLRLSFETSTHLTGVNNPLNWKFGIKCQHGSGLFDLSEHLRKEIHLHFCPGAATELSAKIAQFLKKCITPDSEKDKLFSRMLDTLMMIECYKTHLAQEEDIWDMFIDKAWDAVLEALQLSEDDQELQELQGILRSSMMHAHYMAATGIKESQKDKEGADLACCLACGMTWLTGRQFICPFDHESEADVDEFRNWEDFWGHQVQKGHVICPH
ncbi:hypothetical protein HG530_001608 [Fusarium avenaceum]|nr:hypothetical protein HG530_001608 [Fusarium avenaceum]